MRTQYLPASLIFDTMKHARPMFISTKCELRTRVVNQSAEIRTHHDDNQIGNYPVCLDSVLGATCNDTQQNLLIWQSCVDIVNLDLCYCVPTFIKTLT